MSPYVLEKVYGMKAVDMAEPDNNIEKELIFTDSLNEENWPNRKDFVALVNLEGTWNKFSNTQHAILRTMGANHDMACYTYIIRKEIFAGLIKD